VHLHIIVYTLLPYLYSYLYVNEMLNVPVFMLLSLFRFNRLPSPSSLTSKQVRHHQWHHLPLVELIRTRLLWCGAELNVSFTDETETVLCRL